MNLNISLLIYLNKNIWCTSFPMQGIHAGSSEFLHRNSKSFVFGFCVAFSYSICAWPFFHPRWITWLVQRHHMLYSGESPVQETVSTLSAFFSPPSLLSLPTLFYPSIRFAQEQKLCIFARSLKAATYSMPSPSAWSLRLNLYCS